MFFEPDYDFLLFLVHTLSKKGFLRVELVFNYNSNIARTCYRQLLNEYSIIISKIIVMGAVRNKRDADNKIIFCTEKLTNAQQCGKIGKGLFMCNIESYLRSCIGNSCLYKKIAIDSDGYVKNCPNLKNNYGHISKTDLTSVINRTDFTDLWDIKKEEIDVCQDCEFRDICTDCRAMIKDPENIYSQPSKCGYNPYITKWEGEEGWISVEQWRKENQN